MSETPTYLESTPSREWSLQIQQTDLLSSCFSLLSFPPFLLSILSPFFHLSFSLFLCFTQNLQTASSLSSIYVHVKIPWTEDPGGLQSMRSQRVTHDWVLHWGFPGGSNSTEFVYKAVDLGLIPGSGRSPGEGNGNPLQYSCLENPMNRGAWWATVHGVTKSWTRLSN